MRRRKRCRGCPEGKPASPTPVKDATTKVHDKLSGRKLDATLVTRSGESDALWNHVLFGTGTCIGLIEGYARLGLPGNPAPHLREMIARLERVAAAFENMNEDSVSP